MALVYRLFPPDSYPSSQVGGFYDTGGLPAWTFTLFASAFTGAGWTLDAKVLKGPLESDVVMANAAVFAQVTPVSAFPYTQALVATLAPTDLFLLPKWTVGGAPSLLTGYIEASAIIFDKNDATHLDRCSRQLRAADDVQTFLDKAERKVFGYLRPEQTTRGRYGSTSGPGQSWYLPRSMRVPLDVESGTLAYFLNRQGAVEVLRDAIAAQASLDYDRWRLMAGTNANSQDRQTAAHLPQVADEIQQLLQKHMRPNVSGFRGR